MVENRASRAIMHFFSPHISAARVVGRPASQCRDARPLRIEALRPASHSVVAHCPRGWTGPAIRPWRRGGSSWKGGHPESPHSTHVGRGLRIHIGSPPSHQGADIGEKRWHELGQHLASQGRTGTNEARRPVLPVVAPPRLDQPMLICARIGARTESYSVTVDATLV
jgi:hypothetical protein